MSAPHLSLKVKFGELLVKNNLITPAQLEEALLAQEKMDPKIFLGRVLVNLGYITEVQIVYILSKYFKLPFIKLSQYDVNIEAVNRIPAEDTRKYLVLPVDEIGSILSLAMVNPLDDAAIAHIQRLTGLTVKPLICTEEDMRQALSYYHADKNAEPAPGESGEHVVPPRPGVPGPSAPDPARIGPASPARTGVPAAFAAAPPAKAPDPPPFSFPGARPDRLVRRRRHDLPLPAAPLPASMIREADRAAETVFLTWVESWKSGRRALPLAEAERFLRTGA